nr:hypothetical protein Itr_chr04CG18870 [Ipomoea trifida]
MVSPAASSAADGGDQQLQRTGLWAMQLDLLRRSSFVACNLWFFFPASFLTGDDGDVSITMETTTAHEDDGSDDEDTDEWMDEVDGENDFVLVEGDDHKVLD